MLQRESKAYRSNRKGIIMSQLHSSNPHAVYLFRNPYLRWCSSLLPLSAHQGVVLCPQPTSLVLHRRNRAIRTCGIRWDTLCPIRSSRNCRRPSRNMRFPRRVWTKVKPFWVTELETAEDCVYDMTSPNVCLVFFKVVYYSGLVFVYDFLIKTLWFLTNAWFSLCYC